MDDLAADGGREDSEAIELAALRPQTFLEQQRDRFLAERHRDRALIGIGGRVVEERPVVRLAGTEERARLRQALRSLGGVERGLEVMADARRAADVDAEEVAGDRGRLILFGAVEPAEVDV